MNHGFAKNGREVLILESLFNVAKYQSAGNIDTCHKFMSFFSINYV